MTGIALALAALVQRKEFFALRWYPTRDTAAALERLKGRPGTDR